MAGNDSVKPHPIELWIERTFPGYRFGGVLFLLVATFAFMASGVTGGWVRVVTVGLQGLTLLAALRASQSGRRLFRFAVLVVVIALMSSVASLFISDTNEATGAFFALNVLVVAAAPVVIARTLWRRGVIDLHTVLGAVCIYVLLGMLFSFTYTSIGLIGNEAFFAQTNDASTSVFLYFSFITLTTVGYGDFTPAHGVGRSLASIEALMGQIYLVTVVAAIVGAMVRIRPGTASAANAPATDEPSGAT